MRLVLEDGTTLSGKSFGHPLAKAGEVVFTTGMTGYVETLTDPSFRGQILVCTYPLLGNYGVPPLGEREGLPWPYESSRVQVSGLVVTRYSECFSHHAAERSLGDWLVAEGVPAIEGIDCRGLTRLLRERGTLRGWLLPEGESGRPEGLDMSRVLDEVSSGEPAWLRSKTPQTHGRRLKVALVDCGVKAQIARSLLSRGVDVLVLPWRSDLLAAYDEVDGYMLSNGPGDPKDAGPLITQVAELFSRQKPIFGICLGNQIMALAAGADTYKLPYGHRSQNQPVQDLFTRRAHITSQNHGYAVDPKTLPSGWDEWFVNLNDETNEGIRCLAGPFSAVQFHPEATPGPTDTTFLFDDFLRQLARAR